jgi:hypothetical protein
MTHYHDRLVAGEFAAKTGNVEQAGGGAASGSYDDLTVAELRDLAAAVELEGRSSLTTKDQLVAALEAYDAADDSDD